MLKQLESVINNSPFYNAIRFNPLSDLIIEILHKKVGKAMGFYSDFLDINTGNRIIFDIGANKGNKVLVFEKLGYKVIAVEPEKKAISTLNWRFKDNKNVTIVEKGVSDKEGSLTIHVTEGRSGLNTLSDKWVSSLEDQEVNRWQKKHSYKSSYDVEVTTLDNLMKKYGVPYYIKIDVEGFELNVIRGMKKLPVFLSFETNLPEFLEDTLTIINTLWQLDNKVQFNYSVHDKLERDVWMNTNELTEFLAKTDFRYMEIVCKFNA